MKISKMFYTYNKFSLKWEIIMMYSEDNISDIDVITPEFNLGVDNGNV